jgi:hypothetical protein
MLSSHSALKVELLLIRKNVTSAQFKSASHTFFSWSPDPTVRHTVWGMTIGWTASWALIYGFNQSAVQRYSATETIRQARM